MEAPAFKRLPVPTADRWRGNDESVSQKISIDEVDEFFGLALSNLTCEFAAVMILFKQVPVDRKCGAV